MSFLTGLFNSLFSLAEPRRPEQPARDRLPPTEGEAVLADEAVRNAQPPVRPGDSQRSLVRTGLGPRPDQGLENLVQRKGGGDKAGHQKGEGQGSTRVRPPDARPTPTAESPQPQLQVPLLVTLAKTSPGTLPGNRLQNPESVDPLGILSEAPSSAPTTLAGLAPMSTPILPGTGLPLVPGSSPLPGFAPWESGGVCILHYGNPNEAQGGADYGNSVLFAGRFRLLTSPPRANKPNEKTGPESAPSRTALPLTDDAGAQAVATAMVNPSEEGKTGDKLADAGNSDDKKGEKNETPNGTPRVVKIGSWRDQGSRMA